jgi:hypothetical protein
VIELIRSNDIALLSYISALLAEAGIESVTLDAHTSAIEGSIGAISRRVMVAANDAAVARRILAGAGLISARDDAGA